MFSILTEGLNINFICFTHKEDHFDMHPAHFIIEYEVLPHYTNRHIAFPLLQYIYIHDQMKFAGAGNH